jgi:magnesium chelatase family protein
MIARTKGGVIVGVQAHIVDVETDISSGLSGVTIVGLADTAINESRLRVKAALGNCQAEWPKTRVTVALLPASLPKRGSSLDAAIAVSILAASEQVPWQLAAETLVVGELGLDGSMRPVPGVIATTLAARSLGVTRVLVPAANAGEAALVPDIRVGAAQHLLQVIEVLRGDAPWPEAALESLPQQAQRQGFDLSDVRGQFEARRALEIAAAGGHNISMIGSPGVGKTMLAERLPGLLPPLDDAAAVEVTAIASIAGKPFAGGLVRTPPFEAPHHSASTVSVVGGGRGSRVRIGALTLAHHGVLFLDEAPEFSRRVLESLRTPMERGVVPIDRADFSIMLPARFHLVLAANPCPCGQALSRVVHCSCSPQQRRRYAERLSGPVLDRMDLRLVLQRPGPADLHDVGEESKLVAQRVRAARERSAARWQAHTGEDGHPVTLNAHMPAPTLRRYFPADDAGQRILTRAFDSDTLTMRGADRVLRVAWTLADLAGKNQPGRDEVGYAMSLRGQVLGWAA